jgi:hypothetical protein
MGNHHEAPGISEHCHATGLESKRQLLRIWQRDIK